jgi:hypothetical protein
MLLVDELELSRYFERPSTGSERSRVGIQFKARG